MHLLILAKLVGVMLVQHLSKTMGNLKTCTSYQVFLVQKVWG